MPATSPVARGDPPAPDGLRAANAGGDPNSTRITAGTLADMLVSRAGLSPVMVGRDAELGQLLRLLGAGTGASVALIGGEPGIGKTRLVSELVGTVPPQSRVLVGQADPGTLGQPYHLLLDLVGRADEAALARLYDAGLSPHERLHAGLHLLRSTTGGTGLTVLVVDDLHWADPESMAVVERLVDAPAGRLVVVGTYRPEELTLQHPVAELVQRLERRHTVLHLRLERLVPAEVAGFLAAVYGRTPSHRAAGKLHQRTGGNPFFLEELLKASHETDPDRICVQPLPWTLAEALRSQLADLAPEPRRVLEVAAVLGARVSFDLLAVVTGSAEVELIGILRDLVSRGLLVEAEEDQFGFRHALTREVISGEMLGRQRRRLHEAALEVLLAAESPDPAAVAVHARGAGRYADMVAAARSGSAARLAAGSSYAALKLAELGLEEEPDDPALLSTAATAAWLAGYHEDADRHAQRWLRASVGAEERSPALRLLVRLAWENGDYKTMDARTQDVEDVVPLLPDVPERAHAYAALAQAYMLRLRYPEAVEWADLAAEAAERLDLPEVRLTALVEKGTALQNLEPEVGARILAEVADECERTGAYLAAARALHNMFWYAAPESPRVLDDLLERMRADAERAGFGGLAVSSYHQGKAWVATVRGDLAGAIAALEAVRRLDHGWPPSPKADGVAVPLIALHLESGDPVAAERLLPEVPADRALVWNSVTGLAFQLACWRGDLARARTLLADLATELDGEEFGAAHDLHDVVTAGLAVGLPVATLEAALLVHGTLRPTGHKNKVDADGSPLRALIGAHLDEARGRTGEALDGYRRALATPDRNMPGHRRATAHTGAARCLLALGRPDEARVDVLAATTLLANWPGWRRAELEPLARRLGLVAAAVAPAAEPGEQPGESLTPREREVVALLAEGLSNAELARRLVISRKTAAVHVSNILAKLGMSSRTQVAAWAATRGKD